MWIFSDSQAAIQKLQNLYSGAGQSRTEAIYLIAQRLREKNIKTHLHWVPAHMNIERNELTNNAAKLRTMKLNSVSDKFVSLSYIKRQIKESCLNN